MVEPGQEARLRHKRHPHSAAKPGCARVHRLQRIIRGESRQSCFALCAPPDDRSQVTFGVSAG
ncbi:MAG: hypothetical protein MZV64_23495 [Ignavibacteriales bacterium]|nr:hypothetical protein [Ignavibacteriales bacterium]